MLNENERNHLIKKAEQARREAYAPYSGFSVGAALLTKSGLCYTGANIENASFTPTVCAERVAFFGALHAGERDFSAIAVVGGKSDGEITEYCPPCGVCRQIMAEFCQGDFLILLSNGAEIKAYTLDELFPNRFTISQ